MRIAQDSAVTFTPDHTQAAFLLFTTTDIQTSKALETWHSRIIGWGIVSTGLVDADDTNPDQTTTAVVPFVIHEGAAEHAQYVCDMAARGRYTTYEIRFED